MTAQLRAGAARVDITPPPGVAHAGWGAQQHLRAEGVHRPLTATAIALEQDGLMVVMVGLDLCLLLDDDANAAREAVAALAGVPRGQVRVAFSHTHAGPEVWGSWMAEGLEMQRPYVEMVIHQAAGAAWQAVRQLRPVRVASGLGACDVAVNRRFRTPEGRMVVGRNWDALAERVDRTVGVVRLDTLDEQPYASIVHYAAHPTTLGPNNRLLSPDFPGAARDVVERTLGGTALFLQGAAGNQAAADGPLDSTPESTDRLGKILGCEAARVGLGLRTRPVRDRFVGVVESGASLAEYARDPLPEPDSTLRVVCREVDLPAQQLPPVEEAQAAVTEWEGRLATLRAAGGPAEALREATWRARRTGLILRRAQLFAGRTHRSAEVQGIRLGGAALIGWPVEPFAELGLAIKADSPFPVTLVCGYTNGALGYLPTPEAYGEGGYEVETTPFAPEASGVVVAESRQILAELAGA